MKNGRTVQLTTKDGWTPLYIDGNVNGKFTVKTNQDGNNNQKFYWTRAWRKTERRTAVRLLSRVRLSCEERGHYS